MMIEYNLEHKSILDDMLLVEPNVKPGKMFGYPAYYVGGKLAICLYQQGVGVKIPEESARKLLETDPNVVPFQPLGKPRMREWVQINLTDSERYRQYQSVFDESVQYLLTRPRRPGKHRT